VADKKRISRVTTRTGDHGKTTVATGRSVDKHSQLIGCVGCIDELNSFIGVLATYDLQNQAEVVKDIQQALFDMGAVFAMEGNYPPPAIESLENSVKSLNATLPPLTEFVLPGGTPAASAGHVCRSVCRRAETQLWALISEIEAGKELADSDDTAKAAFTGCAQYLNRLSDYFFVLARALNEGNEEQWQGPKGRP